MCLSALRELEGSPAAEMDLGRFLGLDHFGGKQQVVGLFLVHAPRIVL